MFFETVPLQTREALQLRVSSGTRGFMKPVRCRTKVARGDPGVSILFTQAGHSCRRKSTQAKMHAYKSSAK